VGFRFAGFELDRATFELRHDGEPVPLEPQVLEVLLLLVEHRDRMVTKGELLDRVWGDRFVSESALTSRIKAVRRSLGDDGRTQRFVKTIHGRGYRFVAEVEVTADDGSAIGAAPAMTGSGEERHNLPAERTPLLGRDTEVASVAELIETNRLVSLIGMGGTGKTRLAVAAARRLVDRFPDGTWFVDLAPVSDPRSIVTAVAHAAQLGLGAGSTREQLTGLIAHRASLLVLDNCEHLREDIAELLDHLLERTVAPRFLVTSRVPMGLPDERRMAVTPLGLDPGRSPAVELFVSSAERFGVVLSQDDEDAVLHVCRRLDGLPLAIELAAGQVRHLSLPELTARLDQRFDLLAGRRRPGLERQSSLRWVLDDTWSMLGAGERRLLGLLAAFSGSFGLADAEQLVADSTPGAVAGGLAGLVDWSLVVRDSSILGAARYRLLETVRLFASERAAAGDVEPGSDRHAQWCLDQVGTEVPDHYYDYSAARWYADHYDDLRAAETHLLSGGRHDDAARLAAAAGLAMHLDAGTRAADTLHRIDEHLGRTDDTELSARLHLTATLCAMAARSPAAMSTHGRAAVAAARAANVPSLTAVALVLGSWTTVFEDGPMALEMTAEATELAASVGDDATRNLAEAYRAFHLALLRRYDEAIEVARRVVDRADPAPSYPTDAAAVALACCTLLSDPEGATRLTSSFEIPPLRMWATDLLIAAVAAARGDRATAAATCTRVQAQLVRGGIDGLPDLLVPAAVLAYRLGDQDRASRWLRAVKDAGRPTQSFQMTLVFNRTREAVGLAADSPLASATLGEMGDEALAWIAAQTSSPA
jgi:non-specific serine/threonine protein kinase